MQKAGGANTVVFSFQLQPTPPAAWTGSRQIGLARQAEIYVSAGIAAHQAVPGQQPVEGVGQVLPGSWQQVRKGFVFEPLYRHAISLGLRQWLRKSVSPRILVGRSRGRAV
jgi:hypothetical protein